VVAGDDVGKVTQEKQEANLQEGVSEENQNQTK
jgi:hypothetical protein